MKKILVTGGCGFIGSNFIHYILENYPDISIINIDFLSYAGNPNNLKDIKDRYQWIKADIRDKEAMEKIFIEHEPELVFHFAAQTHVDRSVSAPLIFPETNIMGTANLLEAARKIEIKKFIHVSTDEVYGSIAEGFAKESDPLETSSPYSASKAGSDLLALSYYKTFGLPVCVTRCTNNYGPFCHVEKFIPRQITNAMTGENIKIYGTGKNVRDWLFVQDHCRALWEVSQKGRNGEIYNIGFGDATVSNIDIAEQVLKLVDNPKISIEFVNDRPGHDFRYAVDTNKIQEEVGWHPQVSLHEGLEKTVSWYRQNGWWWQPQKAETENFYKSVGR